MRPERRSTAEDRPKARLVGLGLLLLAACARQPLEPDAPPEAPPEAPTEPPTTPEGSVPEVALPAAGRAPIGAGAVGPLRALIDAGRAEPTAMRLLTPLCDDIGHRLAGSPGLERAVLWAEAALRAVPGAQVRLEPVQVPVWRRGREQAWVTAPHPMALPMLGLGGSGGTPGLEAEVVLAVDVDSLGPEVAGKIVLFDVPMRGPEETTGVYRSIDAYGAAVGARGRGPQAAAKAGAVAALVRSVTTRSLSTPHTGGTRFDPGVQPIPAAAITTEHSAWLRRLIERGVPVRVRLEMEAETLPDALSHNVIAELVGAERPDEIIVLAAHLDSWDVGQGAQDDGAGVAQAMAALALLAASPTPLARTVRVVLFTNEENGLRGGVEYAAQHGGERHVAAIESDIGAGWPRAWSATGSEAQLAWLRSAAAPVGLPVESGGGGADIGPMLDHGVLIAELLPDDSAYFDVHHTWADTLDKIDPVALQEGAVALAALARALSDAPPAPPAAPPAPAP